MEAVEKVEMCEMNEWSLMWWNAVQADGASVSRRGRCSKKVGVVDRVR